MLVARASAPQGEIRGNNEFRVRDGASDSGKQPGEMGQTSIRYGAINQLIALFRRNHLRGLVEIIPPHHAQIEHAEGFRSEPLVMVMQKIPLKRCRRTRRGQHGSREHRVVPVRPIDVHAAENLEARLDPGERRPAAAKKDKILLLLCRIEPREIPVANPVEHPFDWAMAENLDRATTKGKFAC